jgi:hypothetical protein
MLKKANLQEEEGEVHKLKEEIEKLRTESKQLKHRLQKEVDQRKNWQEISKKKDEELSVFKDQLCRATDELQKEKEAHKKTT